MQKGKKLGLYTSHVGSVSSAAVLYRHRTGARFNESSSRPFSSAKIASHAAPLFILFFILEIVSFSNFRIIILR